MQIFLKRKEELIASSWSGGSTTQLMIYPPRCDYKNKDFDFRISVASVEESPSVFTVLKGYKRVLMPLTSDLTMQFKDKTLTTKPFGTVYFDGGENVTSMGVCTDAGIMYKPEYTCKILCGDNGCYPLDNLFTCIFALYGSITASISKDIYLLKQNDFLIIKSQDKSDALKQINLKGLNKNDALIFCINKEFII